MEEKLVALEQKIDKIYISVEKTRKYFLWMLGVTLVAFFLPLFGLIFAIPALLNSLTSGLL